MNVAYRPDRRLLVLASLVVVLSLAGLTRLGARDGGQPSFDVHTETFSGDVQEVLPAGHYTYFRLRDGQAAERWVVVPGTSHRDADQLRVRSFGRRHDFHSNRLGRDFDDLYFVSVLPPEPDEESKLP